MKRIGIVAAVLLVLVCAGLLLPLIGPVFVLLFGWVYFPVRTLPQMTWEPAAIGVGAAALIWLVAIADSLARWLYGHFQAGAALPRPWRLRWSVALVGIVLLLFTSAICMIVTIHESYWVLTANRPLFDPPQVIRRIVSTNNLKQIGLAFHNYQQAFHQFPPGGTFSSDGEMRHSWETMLLPFMEGEQPKPNLDLPWDHPANAECFKTELREFLIPGFGGEHRADEQGYALSHYSVNSRVIGPNRGITIAGVRDGLSQTIFAGEVADRFQPWGHPVNWRDPALGINKSPDGFGGPWSSGGANFLFMDGSVTFLNDQIEPALLRAMSTPAGGEKLPEGVP